MRTKLLLPTFGLVLCCSIVFIFFYSKQSSTEILPPPTSGETIVKEGAEDGDNQKKREEWFEFMHRAAPGTNWRAIEYQTQMQRHVQRTETRNSGSNRSNEEILADGNLIGEWKERGSRNQAGSVFVTEFDPVTEEIYLISAGGTLWKGTLQGTNWEAINQDFRFGTELLKFIPTDTGRRLIATIGNIPHYSDDDGFTWTASTGITINDRWGRTQKSVVLSDNENTIYVLSKPGAWDNLKIYKSTDKGESYSSIQQLASHDLKRYATCKPHHSDEVYLLDRENGTKTSIYQINQIADELDLLFSNDQFGLGGSNSRANLIGILQDTTTTFVVYNSDNEVYASTDFGENWTLNGQMPTGPWSVGIFMSPSNPDFLMYGEVECYVSPNGGGFWNKLNDWGAYYGDVEFSLHADMMYFNEFQRSNGDNFLLISNHGGLSVSYNYGNTKQNIGLLGLNVSQYYSVRTDPVDPGYIYAGSQDQGFQRGYTFNNNDIMLFEQVISGDYGHIVFSQNGTRLWTVYPGGWVTYYGNPHNGGIHASYDLESDNESVWIPPLMAKPNSSANEIYMAGGNMNGGGGSHIIKLEVQGNNIIPSQFSFDFYAESVEGKVSSLKTSPVNPDRWYVGTTNGRFFTSTDDGQTWEQTVDFVPGGHYLYGQAIYPSKFDENTVYFGGSGYSNPAVWKSTNGGTTFNPMNDGLPATLVFDITANHDESMLFAATEAGPFVYIVEEEQWYDMSGVAAPSQTYWSVEYIESLDYVRFGTYGRGIWDFRISESVGVSDISDNNSYLEIYPNPASNLIQIKLENPINENIHLKISNLAGVTIKQEIVSVQANQPFQKEWAVNDIPKGIYVLTARDGDRLYSSKLVLQ